MMTNAFDLLLDELDAWDRTEQPATFWWRDDDARIPGVELDTLFALSERFSVPCGLATVPDGSGEPLRKAVSDQSHIWILQHGYAHANHARGSGKAWELGSHRPASIVMEELRAGKLKLGQLFKKRFLPVMVPPWNRIDPDLVPYLPVMGYRGLSASYGTHRPKPPAGLRVADAHCDVLKWKTKPPVFVGAEKAVNLIKGHLRAKRLGKTDPEEPTCLLTHHLVMPPDAWEFMEALFNLTTTHPAATWMSPVEIWPNP